MNFKNEILNYENNDTNKTYILEIGNIQVILTAVHTMNQIREDGSIKYSEPFTKAIVKYISKELNTSSFIKLIDTGIDSNSVVLDDFKEILLKTIKENNIKLLIDIHGAKEERDFDVEFGTLNNLSADFSTIKELEDAFRENGINNIEHNNPFKGGGITQYIYGNTNIDIIQIEINKKYRDIDNIEELEKVCNSLIDFIKMYTNFN